MLRSAAAVVAGFVATVVLAVIADAIVRAAAPQAFSASGFARDPQMLALVLCYTAIFAVVGGYVAALAAPRRPLRHAIILGAISVVLTAMVSIAMWNQAPAWYHILAILIVLPAAVLGGHLFERRTPRPTM